MTKEQEIQVKKLIKATVDILKKCDEGSYVKNVMEVTAIWDGVECDGYCLLEELQDLIEDLK